MSLLKWSLFFLVFAAIAALMGYGGIAHEAEGIAKVLLVVFLVIAAALIVLGATIYRKVTE